MKEFNKLPKYDPNNLSKTYAGIGSRQTPIHVLESMTKVAKWLDSLGYKLQTGMTFGAKEEGADKAFSDGSTNKELFRPEDIKVDSREWIIASEIHPYWDKVIAKWNGDPKSFYGVGGAKLHARNTNQIFGKNLNTIVDFVIFYAEETNNPLRPKGGTGQAVEMARRKGVPTINIWNNPNWKREVLNVVGEYI